MNKAWLFWIVEIVLVLAAAFFRFALIGYTVLPFVFLGVALILLFYRLIKKYSAKKPLRAKRLRTALTCLIVAGVICLAAVEIPIISNARTDKDPEADYLIVLGAGVNGTVPSLSLLNRIYPAISYLETYPDAKVVVSGGQGEGENITEAECMRLELEKNGIAPERILMEEKSTSTQENIEFSLEIIRADGGSTSGKVAIVSSEYHLYRAKYYASCFGVYPVGVAAQTTLPVLMVNYFLREAFAVIQMWIM